MLLKNSMCASNTGYCSKFSSVAIKQLSKSGDGKYTVTDSADKSSINVVVNKDNNNVIFYTRVHYLPSLIKYTSSI